MEKFASRLKIIRNLNNLSQQELADKLNISRSNISKYESGMLEPNIETIIELTKIFKITSDFLLGISNEERK